jgi:hypothetical protein
MLPVQSSMPASWRMSRRLKHDDKLDASAFEPPNLHQFAKTRMEPVGNTRFSW